MNGRREGVFVHNLALCETQKIGAGTRVWAFAHVMTDAQIGENCNICDHVFVESGAIVGNGVTVKNAVSIWDGVVLSDHVFVGPNVAFTNVKWPRAEFKKARSEFASTLIGRGATLGANATIICGVSVGDYAVVGAGAVVTKNVAPYAIVAGNPASFLGWACACGARLGQEMECHCGRRYKRLGADQIQPA